VAKEPLLVAPAVAAPVGAIAAASTAFRIHVELSRAARPRHPVLFFNPRSGGGKAARFHVGDEARARDIEPVELTPGADLETLVRDAVARGADALAMAGGDGSQAVVAAIAAERRLPYACIPAGTRNHFALDLGVDRDGAGARTPFAAHAPDRAKRPDAADGAHLDRQCQKSSTVTSLTRACGCAGSAGSAIAARPSTSRGRSAG
jgi:hypothetical protein